MNNNKIQHGVKLSNYQKKMLEKIENSNSYYTIRLNNKSLIGSDNLLLSKRQFNKIQKSINNGTGTDLKFKKIKYYITTKNIIHQMNF